MRGPKPAWGPSGQGFSSRQAPAEPDAWAALPEKNEGR